jgi:type III secretory pathway component EscV
LKSRDPGSSRGDHLLDLVEFVLGHGLTVVKLSQGRHDRCIGLSEFRVTLKCDGCGMGRFGPHVLGAEDLCEAVDDTQVLAIRQTSAGSCLALDSAVSKKLAESIKKVVGKLPASGPLPVLLSCMDIRRCLRKLIGQDLYELQVISHQELVPDRPAAHRH